MRYAHTMIRVTDLEKSLRFYQEGLGFELASRQDYEKDRFSLIFLRSEPGDSHAPLLELTYNWDTHVYERGTAFGHLAYQVASIETARIRLREHGYDLSWGPDKAPNGKTTIAFVDDPDGYEIELLEKR